MNACRLIVLDKRLGVRTIGVGEVVERIIGKAIRIKDCQGRHSESCWSHTVMCRF